jgi:glycerate kinase
VSRVVVAPDKFTSSLTAAEVAAAIADGLQSVVDDLELVTIPVADGGDGTVDAAVAAGFERVAVSASGPTRQPVDTSYARRGEVAVVELADVCGWVRLPSGPDPMGATSRGLGEVIAAAVRSGARQVIVGLGGSASTDGGRGLLDALSGTDLAGVELIGASDVDNPLLGPSGAAAVYAPQKGATPDQVVELENRLQRWAEQLDPQLADVPGAGAAGGVGFALLHLGARLRPGIDVLLELTDLDTTLPGSTLLITGEGSLDAQTLHGKAVGGLAARARRARVPAVAIAGQCSLDPSQLDQLGLAAVYPLVALEPDTARAIRDAASLVRRQAHAVAKDFLS